MSQLEDIFDPAVTARLVQRIRALEPGTTPAWGKMNAAQMLAHCSAIYEFVLDEAQPRANPIMRAFLRIFAKRTVVGAKPYPRGTPTAPAFKVPPDQDFGREQERLVAYLEQTAALGGEHFDGRENPNFGHLSRAEWSNLFHKHLDHHLRQFRV